MALSKNTTANADEISLAEALITGAIEAMALPPQIAVPEEIKKDIFLSKLNRLVRNKPKPNTAKTERAVSLKPSEPAETALSKAMQKPKAITAV